MGHCIRAIIGAHETVRKITDDWLVNEIELLQGFGMVFLTDRLLEDVEELMELSDELVCPELDYFSEAAADMLERYSFHTKLIYVETDYFGGVGTQAGVLYENGRIAIAPRKAAGTINILLRALGAWCKPGKDEFDSLGLGKYRHMSDE